MDRYPIVIILAGIVGLAALFLSGGTPGCTELGYETSGPGMCCEGLQHVHASYTYGRVDNLERWFCALEGDYALEEQKDCAGVGEGIYYQNIEEVQCCEGLEMVMTSRSGYHCVYPF